LTRCEESSVAINKLAFYPLNYFEEEIQKVFKNKVWVIMAVIVLALAVVAMSCAPAAKPAATTPPPAATLPAATPPAAPPAPPGGPTAPAATAPAAIKTSFDATTYTNDANGFTFMYPKTWVKGEAVNDQVVNLVASTAQGADSINADVLAQAADFSVAMKAAYDADPQLKSLGVKVDIVSTKPVTLADGKTQGNEAIISAKIMGLYDLYGYGIGVNKGGKTIMLTGFTLGGQAKKDQITEICKTLALK
jgi:hypothetical protein